MPTIEKALRGLELSKPATTWSLRRRDYFGQSPSFPGFLSALAERNGLQLKINRSRHDYPHMTKMINRFFDKLVLRYGSSQSTLSLKKRPLD